MDHAPSGECRQASAFLQQRFRPILSEIKILDQGMASVRVFRATTVIPSGTELKVAGLPGGPKDFHQVLLQTKD
jgi:hypothetical protein